MGLGDVLLRVAAIIGAVVTVLGFVALVWRGFRRAFRATVGRKGHLYRLLSNLAPDVQVEYFDAQLGAPAFKNAAEAEDEYIYVNPYFFVQAVADKGHRVLAYTVTTRHRRFHPPVWGREVQWSSSSSGFYLGTFAFSELPMAQSPTGLVAWLGARRFQYAESYYFGNPGLYQTYLLGVNEVGAIDETTMKVISLLGPETRLGALAEKEKEDNDALQIYLEEARTREFRSSARPNTYGVISRTSFGLRIPDLLRWIGPDGDQVRVLPL